MNKFILLSIVFSLTLLSCSSEGEKAVDTNTTPAKEVNSKEIDYKALAGDVCQCMSPIVEVMKHVNDLTKAEKIEELRKYSEESQGILQKADGCFRGLEATYGKIDNITDEAFSVALKNSCPEVADLVARAKELGKLQKEQQNK